MRNRIINTIGIVTIAIGLNAQTYKIVDTGVKDFYSNEVTITEPQSGGDYYGQDAHYEGNQPSYTNHSNGTITDNHTGLMWQKDMGSKISYAKAYAKADTLTLGGHTDWRVPTIKELYSLILFTGKVKGEMAITMFIDTNYFNQPIGDTTIGEREIDAQTWSSTQYVGTTMRADTTVFGVNFVDGRIKGYPKYDPKEDTAKAMYFRLVRGNTDYGINNFKDNENGTISDLATGLMWQQADDGIGRDWSEALMYSDSLTFAVYTDWRLPNAKELQSIVDYTRCPDITSSPAIDPMFLTTEIQDPDGNWGQYPYFWTGTTHLDGTKPASGAVYVAFGEAQGEMNGNLMDVHGAGAQRSDPKSGDISAYPMFQGPQGDVRYVYNYVRAVRTISSNTHINSSDVQQIKVYPTLTSNELTIASKAAGKYKIVDVSGREMIAGYLVSEIMLIDITGLVNNLYFVIVETENGIVIEKVIKN
ncbi:DUF1566 domain-containing protein [Bacteroidales bacterium]|nr:DUF1566 domain-containing protein [Bacteroidales bacterium]